MTPQLAVLCVLVALLALLFGLGAAALIDVRTYLDAAAVAAVAGSCSGLVGYLLGLLVL